jgi:hypothetical protein
MTDDDVRAYAAAARKAAREMDSALTVLVQAGLRIAVSGVRSPPEPNPNSTVAVNAIRPQWYTRISVTRTSVDEF